MYAIHPDLTTPRRKQGWYWPDTSMELVDGMWCVPRSGAMRARAAIVAAGGGASGILLDDLTGFTATAAFCTHSYLRAAYTSSVVEVRAGTTANIDGSGSGVEVNVETHCGAANGFCRTWYDQTGNARHWTQTTNADQPKIHDSATGGLHGATNSKLCIKFDGSDDLMKRSNNMGVTGDPTVSIIWDQDAATISTDVCTWCLGDDSSSNQPLSIFWNSSTHNLYVDRWDDNSAYDTTSHRETANWYILTRTAGDNLSATAVYRNGSALTVTGSNTGKPNINSVLSTLGAHAFSGGNFPWPGDMTTWIAGNSVITSGSANFTTLSTWMTTNRV